MIGGRETFLTSRSITSKLLKVNQWGLLRLLRFERVRVTQSDKVVRHNSTCGPRESRNQANRSQLPLATPLTRTSQTACKVKWSMGISRLPISRLTIASIVSLLYGKHSMRAIPPNASPARYHQDTPTPRRTTVLLRETYLHLKGIQVQVKMPSNAAYSQKGKNGKIGFMGLWSRKICF